jgi:hypothetical protein
MGPGIVPFQLLNPSHQGTGATVDEENAPTIFQCIKPSAVPKLHFRLADAIEKTGHTGLSSMNNGEISLLFQDEFIKNGKLASRPLDGELRSSFVWNKASWKSNPDAIFYARKDILGIIARTGHAGTALVPIASAKTKARKPHPLRALRQATWK